MLKVSKNNTFFGRNGKQWDKEIRRQTYKVDKNDIKNYNQ